MVCYNADMNKTKLAITIDKDLADFVKRYAEDHGLSVSAAVNRMLLSWTEDARHSIAPVDSAEPKQTRRGKAQA